MQKNAAIAGCVKPYAATMLEPLLAKKTLWTWHVAVLAGYVLVYAQREHSIFNFSYCANLSAKNRDHYDSYHDLIKLGNIISYNKND